MFQTSDMQDNCELRGLIELMKTPGLATTSRTMLFDLIAETLSYGPKISNVFQTENGMEMVLLIFPDLLQETRKSFCPADLSLFFRAWTGFLIGIFHENDDNRDAFWEIARSDILEDYLLPFFSFPDFGAVLCGHLLALSVDNQSVSEIFHCTTIEDFNDTLPMQVTVANPRILLALSRLIRRSGSRLTEFFFFILHQLLDSQSNMLKLCDRGLTYEILLWFDTFKIETDIFSRVSRQKMHFSFNLESECASAFSSCAALLRQLIVIGISSRELQHIFKNVKSHSKEITGKRQFLL